MFIPVGTEFLWKINERLTPINFFRHSKFFLKLSAFTSARPRPESGLDRWPFETSIFLTSMHISMFGKAEAKWKGAFVGMTTPNFSHGPRITLDPS